MGINPTPESPESSGPSADGSLSVSPSSSSFRRRGKWEVKADEGEADSIRRLAAVLSSTVADDKVLPDEGEIRAPQLSLPLLL